MRHPVARQPLPIAIGKRSYTGQFDASHRSSARRLILQAGWTCLVLDKVAGKARLERKFLFWNLKPSEARLSDISRLTIDAVPDRASGGRAYYIALDLRNGAGWLFRATDKDDAESIVAAVRSFLGAVSLTRV